jgi:hypothetical protein
MLFNFYYRPIWPFLNKLKMSENALPTIIWFISAVYRKHKSRDIKSKTSICVQSLMGMLWLWRAARPQSWTSNFVLSSASNYIKTFWHCLLVHVIISTAFIGVLLEKSTVAQLRKNFTTFYGTRRFITVFTRARQWPLSWARQFQSIPPHPISYDPF